MEKWVHDSAESSLPSTGNKQSKWCSTLPDRSPRSPAISDSGEGTLCNWVNAHRKEQNSEEAALTVSDRARLHELERDNRDLRMENEFPKKAVAQLPRRGNSERQLRAHGRGSCAAFPIAEMCGWLDVSKSGYYEWRDRPASLSERRREELRVKIEQIFDGSYETYGYRRVHAQLVRDGEDVFRRAGPPAHARAGPCGLPAAALQARHDRRGRRGGHPRSGGTGLHGPRAGQQAGRRHHLHPDVAGVGRIWPR